MEILNPLYIRSSMGSLGTSNGGSYWHAKELCIRVVYQFFQTILGAKFDENNTSAYFYSKNWQIKAGLKREHDFSVN